MKSEASNVDKNLVETIIAELTKQNVIVNKETCHKLDTFITTQRLNNQKISPLSNLLLLRAKKIKQELTKSNCAKTINKSLSQSCPKIFGNLLNI